MQSPSKPGAPSWSAVHKLLHWLVAVAVLVQLSLGYQLDEFADEDPARREMLGLHATLGIVILALMAVRLAWRLSHPVPPPPASLSPALARAARAVHLSFYVLLLVQPVIGLLLVAASGDTVPLAAGLELPGFGRSSGALRATLWYLHTFLAGAIALLVIGHVCAALRHALLRDGTVSRMLPGG